MKELTNEQCELVSGGDFWNTIGIIDAVIDFGTGFMEGLNATR
jgi:hypothetical protein